MKSKREAVLWDVLTGTRFTWVISALFLVLCVAATVIYQETSAPGVLERTYPPELLYFMKQAGLTDLFHSGWFILVLILLGVNLLCSLIDRLPEVWKEARKGSPAPVSIDALFKSKGQGNGHFGVEIQTTISREQFREAVEKGSYPRLGRLHPIRDGGGLTELQLSMQEGRWSRFAVYVAHLALIPVLIGGCLEMLSGFEGQVTLDEGSRVRYLQVTRGAARQWPRLVEKGKEIPGFYEPGFEVECGRFDPKTFQSQLSFIEGGKTVASRQAGYNEPVHFKKIRFVQASTSKTAQNKIGLSIRNARTGESSQLASLIQGHSYETDGAIFKVLELKDGQAGEDLGLSAQIEYREPGQQAERFWIFQKFPRYDQVHRRQSRFHFALESVEPRYTINYRVSHTPGFGWIVGGCTLLVLSLFGALLFSFNRIWYVWRPGRVFCVGWSSRATLFAGDFEEAANEFKTALSKFDRSIPAGPVEVRHGSG